MARHGLARYEVETGGRMASERTAVLVDGDNVSAVHAGRILAEAGRLGRVDVARVYAAACRVSGWLTTPGFRLLHAGSGKNGADLLLCLDAMELAFLEGFACFAIATSDRDFTHLAQRLRERGHHVLGLGEAKAPVQFRAACTSFIVLAPKATAPSPAPAQPPAPAAAAKPGPGIGELDRQIRAMIAQHSRNGQGMRLAELAPKLHGAHGVRISTLPERSWRAYLTRRPGLYDLEPRGPDAKIRVRPEGFASELPG
jgi:hypothetical protein